MVSVFANKPFHLQPVVLQAVVLAKQVRTFFGFADLIFEVRVDVAAFLFSIEKPHEFPELSSHLFQDRQRDVLPEFGLLNLLNQRDVLLYRPDRFLLF